MLYVVDDIDASLFENPLFDGGRVGVALSELAGEALEKLNAWSICANAIDRKTYHNLEASCTGFYRISLAPPRLFPGAHEYLNLTRSVARIGAAANGPFQLRERPGSQPIDQQLVELANALKSRRVSEAVILDDSVGPGGMTVRYVCRELLSHGLAISEIAAGIGRAPYPHIEGVPVRIGVELNVGDSWVNLRDLIWGFPGGGITFVDEGAVVGGIPYGLSRFIAAARVIGPELALNFCQASADFSCAFWQSKILASRRPITLRDVPRLYFLEKHFGASCPLIEVIESVRTAGFRMFGRA
jgi:hypothetical protein